MKRASFVKGAFCLLFFLCLALSFFLVKRYKLLGVSFRREKVEVEVENIIKHFPFSEEVSLKEWDEKILKGRVVYAIEKSDSLSYTRAESRKAASALYYKIKLDIQRRPVISWKWRVDKFPKRNPPERIKDIEEEDFAARVYIIFPAAFFTNSKVIEYIWSETIPAGTSGTSGYSENIKVLVLEEGKTDDWRFERRDIYEDYVNLFGENPGSDVNAIAFMTDADSTKTEASAVYDEIKVAYRK